MGKRWALEGGTWEKGEHWKEGHGEKVGIGRRDMGKRWAWEGGTWGRKSMGVRWTMGKDGGNVETRYIDSFSLINTP